MKTRKVRFRPHRYIGVMLGILLVLIGITRSLSMQETKAVATSFTIQAAPTQLSWSSTGISPSPIGRVEALTALGPDKRLYVFGGYINKSFNPTKRSDVYDPVSNKWSQIADMPKALTHVGVVAYGRNIYFAGGYEGKTPGAATYGGQVFATKYVWKYNIDSNSWDTTSLPPLPEARGSGAIEILNKQLHFFGGADTNRKDKGEHWILSLEGGKTWVKSASLPNARTHLGRASIGGKIYAVGGQHDVDSKLVTQNSVHVWDPAKPSVWTAVRSLPRARSHISSSTFIWNNRIIVVGGEIAHSKAISDVTAYDPLSNSWTEYTPLPLPKVSGVARQINNQIFFTTGGAAGANFATTTYKGVPIIVSSLKSSPTPAGAST